MMDKSFALNLHSIRTRLVLLNVLVLALTLAVLGCAVRYSVMLNLSRAMDAGLLSFAKRTQDRFPQPPNPSPDLGHGRVANGVGPGYPNFSAKDSPFGRFGPEVYDTRGNVLMRSPNNILWDPASYQRSLSRETVFSTRKIEGEQVRVLSAPLYRNGRVIAVLQMAKSLSPISDQVRQVSRTLLALIPIGMMLAALGGLFLTQRALHPVRQITHAAANIEVSNLSGRLEVAGHDEFSELADTFNGMLARLHSAFADIEQAYEQQRRFTADASHELRTPLSIIKANTSLALSSPGSAESYRKALEAIDSAVDRSNSIIQGLLLMARADAGQYEIERSAVLLSTVIADAIETVKDPVGADVHVKLQNKSVMISADQESMTRVFVNLLQNSRRHTPSGGRIDVRARTDNQQIVIEVADNGEGISQEHLPHLFERFYRADPARARSGGGTGLGLAICKAIVEAHGGTIRLDSLVGKGTKVTITLPALDVQAAKRVPAEVSTAA